MATQSSLLAVLVGFALRLGIPVLITLLVIYLLRRLDAHWQAEVEQEKRSPAITKVECWKTKGCTPEQRRNCAALSSPLPCWQVSRLKDGRLKEECLGCEIFLKAPLPTKA
jgi:hypothetical protein